MTNKATLNNLIAFVPENDAERTIYNVCKKDVINDYLQDTKSTWSNGTFYLGGFIKMKPDEEITMKNIDKANAMREKSVAENGVCNSAEMASVWRSERQLKEIKEIVKKYEEIYKLRVEIELNKIKGLNNDMTYSIVGFI
jgi:hypothetical protein